MSFINLKWYNNFRIYTVRPQNDYNIPTHIPTHIYTTVNNISTIKRLPQIQFVAVLTTI